MKQSKNNRWKVPGVYTKEVDISTVDSYLKTILYNYTLDEIIDCIGMDKLQNHLRENKTSLLNYNKIIFRSPGVWVKEPPSRMDVLRRELTYHTLHEIIDCVGIDKIQNHLRKNKLKTLKNGWNV